MQLLHLFLLSRLLRRNTNFKFSLFVHHIIFLYDSEAMFETELRCYSLEISKCTYIIIALALDGTVLVFFLSFNLLV